VSHFVDNLAVFGRLLRTRGVHVHCGRLLDLTEALQHVDIGSRADVRMACRALLVHRHEDLALFDAAFEAFWRTRDASETALNAEAEPVASESPAPSTAEDAGRATPVKAGATAGESGSDRDGAVDAIGVRRTWSDVGTLVQKDVADFTQEEITLARAALRRLVWRPGERRTRRWRSGPGSRIDLRRALARSVRSGGDIATLPRRRRRTRPRPIVLLCDVSGSMERYTRMLLHLVHEIGRRHRGAETFLFSTALTRVTGHLRARWLNDAVEAVSRSVPGWWDGTRTGDALRVFHQRWARVVLRRGPVVLLISDGWDRGDPTVLRDQVARLQRSCHRLIWLNPLIGTEGYAPLTRGLVAALPFVDDFLPARTLGNLSDLALHLNVLAAARQERR